jgi:hypothetical protein
MVRQSREKCSGTARRNLGATSKRDCEPALSFP